MKLGMRHYMGRMRKVLVRTIDYDTGVDVF